MIKLINKVTGSYMWVADDKAVEYLAAGHVPAVKVETPKKKTTKSGKPVPKKTVKVK